MNRFYGVGDCPHHIRHQILHQSRSRGMGGFGVVYISLPQQNFPNSENRRTK